MWEHYYLFSRETINDKRIIYCAFIVTSMMWKQSLFNKLFVTSSLRKNYILRIHCYVDDVEAIPI